MVHVVSGGGGEAVFPRTLVRAGAASRAGVVEIVVDVDAGLLAELPSPPQPDSSARLRYRRGRAGHLVVPLTEIEVADDATLSFVSVQSLGPDTWQLAHQGSTIGAHATLQSFAVALGGSYARLRTDSALQGESGTSLLRAAFIGRDDQMLDFRTLQDHLAPRTTSDLLFMGAVADHAHSVYSGLIRVRRGAVRSDAMQTNHNLVLDEGAHADSVPNLDIEENDVKCSHGSTVGPVDEDQRYYLESRGVEPERGRTAHRGRFLRGHRRPGPHRRDPVHGGPGPGRPDRGDTVPEAGLRIRAARPSGSAAGPTWSPARPADSTWPACGWPWCGSTTTSTPSGDRCSHEDYSLADGEVLGGRVRDRVRQARVDLRPPHRRAVLAPGHPAGARLRAGRRRATTSRWWCREHR